jgi:hypothetical protein
MAVGFSCMGFEGRGLIAVNAIAAPGPKLPRAFTARRCLMTDLAASRRRMVQDQLQGRGVRDALLLRAMERAARERFVPSDARPHVFEDRPIPVAEGVVLPQAHITAYRIEALARAPRAAPAAARS